MDPLNLFWHLLAFAAPALAVGLAVAVLGRWLIRSGAVLRLPVQAGVNAAAGTLVLAAGFWIFGVDGKMASYAGLVVAVATAQWLGSKAWKG